MHPGPGFRSGDTLYGFEKRGVKSPRADIFKSAQAGRIQNLRAPQA
jgi:hypothetical protein